MCPEYICDAAPSVISADPTESLGLLAVSGHIPHVPDSISRRLVVTACAATCRPRARLTS